MRLGVANAKGGAGKTTLATLLTLFLVESGKSVEIEDNDEQGSFKRWLKSVEGLQTKEKGARGLVVGKGEATIFIADYPPSHPEELAKMVAGNDRVIVPCLPSPIDVSCACSFIKACTIPALFVWNCIEIGSTLGRSENLSAMLAPHGITALKTTIPKRVAYRLAQVGGLASLNDEAQSPILRLALEVIK